MFQKKLANNENTRARTCRKGASAVEFAIVAPVLILIVFGIVEFGRAMMIQQVITNASREGARHAIIESSSVSEVESIIQSYLDGALVKSATVSVVPSDLTTLLAGDPVTVSISVPYQENSWVSFFNMSIQLTAETTMQAERFD